MAEKRKKRRQVQVSSASSACGHVGHMTVDELRKVMIGDDFDASCPVCGQVHLTREEVEEIEKQKITDTQEYHDTTREAEATPLLPKK